ncbi:histidine phosphatase family protein [Pyxidicoccus sp. 3LFB2]
MGVVYLVRHGQASFGAADYDQLSETGLAQARVLGETLRPRLPARTRSSPAPWCATGRPPTRASPR